MRIKAYPKYPFLHDSSGICFAGTAPHTAKPVPQAATCRKTRCSPADYDYFRLRINIGA